ncbi:AAA family ATPase [Helcococcus bovis]|uniref:AAA family ATPase n=1 Tax=Helcococcus bovis TaxID=3153252 RepID=UPI0038BB8F9D
MNREGLTLDYDSLTHDEMEQTRERMKELNINYVLYSTASYDGTNGKFRIVIPFDRPIKVKEYEGVFENFIKKSKLIECFDTASIKPEHSFNVPTRIANIKPIFEFEKEKGFLKVDDYIKTIKDKNENTIKEIQVAPTKYTNKQAIKLVSEHLSREDISDYERFLPPFFSIVKGVQLGELEEDTGRELMALLANGNPEHEKGNLKMFDYHLRKEIPRTEYTFQKRFDFKKTIEKEKAKENKFLHTLKNRKVTKGYKFNEISYHKPLAYVEGLLPQGVGWLAGEPKIGKSFFAVQMLNSISNGEDFLGRRTKKCNVIYYSLEMDENLMKCRLTTMYGNKLITDAFTTIYDLPVGDDELLFRILEHDILEYGAKVIAIDTYGIVAKRKNSKTPLYEQSYDEIRVYKDLADKYALSCLLVTHLNKNTQGVSLQDRIMGSTANRGAVDFNIILAKDEDKKFRLMVESRKLQGEDLILSKDPETLLFEVEDTVDNYQRTMYLFKLRNNPIVKAVLKQLENKPKLEASATDILDLIPEFERIDEKGEDLTISKIGRRITKLIPELQKHFNIFVTYSKIDNKRTYIFVKE